MRITLPYLVISLQLREDWLRFAKPPLPGKDYLQNLGKQLVERQGSSRERDSKAFFAISPSEFSCEGSAPTFFR
jgi:hypothetical protein